MRRGGHHHRGAQGDFGPHKLVCVLALVDADAEGEGAGRAPAQLEGDLEAAVVRGGAPHEAADDLLRWMDLDIDVCVCVAGLEQDTGT